ncbi:hypothetical protein DB771_06325 [Burkholderia sp. AU29985]|nr:hypothetical protein XM57_06320 [Burkholderia cepacia]AYZ97340.1 hypothetical protein EGY28_20180 [Burkholderia dolosa]ETP66767.1 hypothetical protein BDSB_02885 [Burkholderia dolosa PC543]PRE52822.1 hypothetical protein C6P87_07980 [Burkholderia sp. AU12872]PUA77693.1 hypothetical protein DB771_06325 [Burkholderia sp. AU29985]
MGAGNTHACIENATRMRGGDARQKPHERRMQAACKSGTRRGSRGGCTGRAASEARLRSMRCVVSRRERAAT